MAGLIIHRSSQSSSEQVVQQFSMRLSMKTIILDLSQTLIGSKFSENCLNFMKTYKTLRRFPKAKARFLNFPPAKLLMSERRSGKKWLEIFLRLLKHLRVLRRMNLCIDFSAGIKIAALKHFYGMMVIFHEIFTVLISLVLHAVPFYASAKMNPAKAGRRKLVINIKRLLPGAFLHNGISIAISGFSPLHPGPISTT